MAVPAVQLPPPSPAKAAHHQRKLPITCFKLHTLRIPWNDRGHRAERSVENFAQNVQLLLIGAGNGPSKSFAVYQTP